eukprot:Partr_v1_DN45819_c0_g1_i1_m58207 putative prefoldin subunit 2
MSERAEREKQAIIQRYQQMMEEEKALLTKVAELNAQESEYRLVADSIRPLDPARKCFQMIGGVLVERTVGDVLPVVEQNRDSLAAVVKSFGEQLAKKAAERSAYQREHGIQAVPQGMAQQLMAAQQKQ